MGSKTNRKQMAAADGCGRDVKEAAAWASFYKEVAIQRIEPVPKGWRTVSEIAKMLGMSKSGLSNTFLKKINDGKLKPKLFKIRAGSFVRNIRHYYCEQVANQKD